MIKTNLKYLNNIINKSPIINKRLLSFTTNQKVLNSIPTPSISIPKNINVKIPKSKNGQNLKGKVKKISNSAKQNNKNELNNKRNEMKKIENQLNKSTINENQEIYERSDDEKEEEELNTELIQRLSELKIKYKNLDKKLRKKNKKPTQNNKHTLEKSVKKTLNKNNKITKINSIKSGNVIENQNIINDNYNEISQNTENENQWKYFSRINEEKKIKNILLNSKTSISIISGPSFCGKTTIIQKVLQDINIDYFVLETNDFQNSHTLYNALVNQSTISMPSLKKIYTKNNKLSSGNNNNNGSSVDNELLFALNQLPEQVPIIIDDASSIFNCENNDNECFTINPTIFEWIYSSLENNKKLNLILVTSNPLVECWVDTNIPKEIINRCSINDLTYDEAEDFFNNYINDNGLSDIDITFNDIYGITGSRISIISEFIQEYINFQNDNFIDMDFSYINKAYNVLNELLIANPDQSSLIKRIMAIIVSESYDRGYVEEKELEYIFENNNIVEYENGKIINNKIQHNSMEFWEIIAIMIEKNVLNRRIEVFNSNKKSNSTLIQRPVIIPENQCIVYAMNMILSENNIILKEI